ncbi:hypothetical protein OBB02_00725 [Candidatus Puniceispirillum sp.]|nr:hypothetical protein [Candidatus Puniceispirillum sp.]
MKQEEDNNPLHSYYSVHGKLKEQYDYVILVSHSRHVSKIITPKEKTLVVSSDWLLMNKLDKLGYTVVYFEYGLRSWGEQELESQLYTRTNDWLYINGVDQTIYNGVSLGKLFARDISLIYISYTRLNGALSYICDEFAPKKIFLYDYRSEFDFLDEFSKLEIVEEVCQQRGIELVNSTDCPDASDDEFPQRTIYGNNTAPVESYSLLRNLYGSLIEFLSLIVRSVTNKRSKVLVMTGGHLSQTLSKFTKSENITPIYFSSVLTKRPREILLSIWRGSYLAKRLLAGIEEANNEAVQQIIDRYLKHWDGLNPDVITTIVRRHITKNIFTSKRIRFYTAQIHLTQRFLLRHQPKRVLLDSVFAAESRILMEIAKATGVKIDYIWHGYWMQIIGFDALGGDPRTQTLVDRVYTWGEQNERWLDAINWQGENVRVGNPFAQKYLKMRESNRSKELPKNILVLQYTPMNTDLRGLNANQYGFFVDIVRRLEAIGDFNIRLKLHPGVWKKSYYERIKDQYSLGCEIRNDGPFEKHIRWADIVIGPAHSGAYLEVLAANKPYYPVIMMPQSKMVHAKHTKFYEDLGLLIDDIRNSVLHDQDKALEELTSINQFPNPALALMDALGND